MKKIMVYGDSNTWGHNPNESHPKTGVAARYTKHVRWTGVMQDKLGDEYEVIEEGYCGRTIVYDDPLAYGRNGLSALEIAFRTNDPIDLIIIMLGTNDIKDMFNPHPVIIEAAMDRMIRELKNLMAFSNSPDAKIMIVNPARITPCSNGEFVYGFSQLAVDIADDMREKFKGVAQMHGCEFFDADAVDGVVVDGADGTHLTVDAHKALGIAIADKVRSII